MKHTFFTLFFMLLVAQTATILTSDQSEKLVPGAPQGEHPFGHGSREHRRPSVANIVTTFNNNTIGAVQPKSPSAATPQPDAVEALMCALAAQSGQQSTEPTQRSVSDQDEQPDATAATQQPGRRISKAAQRRNYVQELEAQIRALTAPRSTVERATSPISPHSESTQQSTITQLKKLLEYKEQELLLRENAHEMTRGKNLALAMDLQRAQERAQVELVYLERQLSATNEEYNRLSKKYQEAQDTYHEEVVAYRERTAKPDTAEKSDIAAQQQLLAQQIATNNAKIKQANRRSWGFAAVAAFAAALNFKGTRQALSTLAGFNSSQPSS